MDDLKAWIARVRHDLLKQAVWRVRDLGDLGREPTASDRAALARGLVDLRDGEGNPASASALWRQLRDELPATPTPEIEERLGAIDRLVGDAEDLARRLDGEPRLWSAVAERVGELAAAFESTAHELILSVRP
jgi:hypothetical protein